MANCILAVNIEHQEDDTCRRCVDYLNEMLQKGFDVEEMRKNMHQSCAQSAPDMQNCIELADQYLETLVTLGARKACEFIKSC